MCSGIISSLPTPSPLQVAIYKPETFEKLAYDLARKNLIKSGYSPDLTQLTFDWRYMVRGLTIDKKRGNMIKTDRHKYCKVAFHGFKPLTREERMRTYNQRETRDAFDEPDYTLIDTMFSLSEAYLYMQASACAVALAFELLP